MDTAVEAIELIDLQRQLSVGIADIFPDRVWVKAEVDSVQVKSNGHCYLDLVQSDGNGVVAKAKAVIWRSRYFALGRYYRDVTGGDISAGQKILVRVQVSYSELYGISLSIDEIEPQFTLGEQELEKQRTIGKLTKEGFMELQQGLALADIPRNLAVISAPDAAGFGDFSRHIEENEYGFKFRVKLFEATMQGQNAPESIIEALECIQTDGTHFDAVLIMRGGGSNFDLACYDDYALALSIAQCSIPVFTAIGHDRDYHIADMVSFRFVKTPTALADLFIDCLAAEDERVSSFGTRLRLAFSARISRMNSAVDMLESRIRSANPRNILSRGYTLVTDDAGVVLKSSKSVRKGEVIRVMFEDGTVEAVVK